MRAPSLEWAENLFYWSWQENRAGAWVAGAGGLVFLSRIAEMVFSASCTSRAWHECHGPNVLIRSPLWCYSCSFREESRSQWLCIELGPLQTGPKNSLPPCSQNIYLRTRGRAITRHLWLLGSQTLRDTFVVYKLPSLLCFVIAAQQTKCLYKT